MKSITEIPDLKDKKVLVRVDWSDGGYFNIEVSQATLKYLADAGAKIILATHIDEKNTQDLKQCVPEGTEILENLRENSGEESNSDDFAKKLAARADIYVNEAFSVSHRKHASIVGVPKFLPSFAGFRFIEEVNELSKAFNSPHPFFLILGGAKFETKLPLVEKLLDIADIIFIGGAMAKNVSLKHSKIILPIGDLMALDANGETIENLKLKIENSKFIIWNGPLGNYENGYKEGTLKLAQILSESGKYIIVGGGDTLEVIKELNILDKFSFVSTGGAAMLEFLAKSTLPGIEALK